MRKIGVFTGNRAEYDLLYPVLCELKKTEEIELQVFVSGAHLDSNFGETVSNIVDDGFVIRERIYMHDCIESLSDVSLSIGNGIVGITKALARWEPDILVVYGDRFESFSASVAASQMGIPVSHIEGGDMTEGGALDDNIRHAITKLSHLHFTTNKSAEKNVLSLGEERWRVSNVGLPSLDRILSGELASEREIVERFGLDLNRPIVLFTQHSVALEYDNVLEQIKPSLIAIEKMLNDGVQVIMTYPNNDVGGKEILNELKSFKESNKKGVHLESSLGGYFYHGILALSRDSKRDIVCLGNSSSGIKETSIFCCPAINVGSRQDGRLRGSNVIDVNYEQAEISQALKKCLFDESFRKSLLDGKHLYGDGTAGRKIAERLINVQLGKKLLRKKHFFYDV